MQLRQLLAGAAAGVLGWAGLAAPVDAAAAPALAASVTARPGPGARARQRVELIIPRLRLDGRVREGVSESNLKRGVGHYPGTARPGQVGNAVFLGHRTTGAAPFGDLEELTRDDPVVLVSGNRRYVYRVTGTKIILPGDRRVLAPVPMEPGRAATEGWVTLVTCYPRGFDSHRFVVFAHLDH
ncbi:class E sortase [Actinomadura harenae]|uniref:Class E sortase n=1 Tax=Actinomadura harenae TaxID=2483351 RepID=A0A3M2LUG1_9ACTN|nr:class E sortase [Actinomadura harenae]RMI39645.1 class E sortase [Actinomadura harenae]